MGEEVCCSELVSRRLTIRSGLGVRASSSLDIAEGFAMP
jgi:hypothetical protein